MPEPREDYLRHVDRRALFLFDRLVDAFEFAVLGRSILREEERNLELHDDGPRRDEFVARVREAEGDYRLASARCVRLMAASVDHLSGRSRDLGVNDEDKSEWA